MKITFDTASKYFFRTAGIITALGAMPVMLSPVDGLKLVTGLTYFDWSPQVSPIIGHWGIMVTGIGILLFVSATHKPIRKTTVVFSTLEKAYMVGFALYSLLNGAPYAMNYLTALIADSLMTIGGIWYWMRSTKLNKV